MAAPPPVPALPDTERRTRYSISAQTGPFSVNFALFGESTDFTSWLGVYINGVATTAFTLTSPSGPIASLPCPITDAVVTLNAAATGTLDIVGARRPRRPSQFTEGRGVPARDLNQEITDIVATARERWDQMSRVIQGVPGDNFAPFVLGPRNSTLIGFDASGNLTSTSLTSGIITATAGAKFNTRSLAAAATIGASIQFVETAGFAAAGDFGGTLYKKVGGTTPGGFQSADGAWWSPAGPVANVVAYGAVGDGATDCTAAIGSAMNSGFREVYIPDGTYLCNVVTVTNTVGLIRGTGTLKSNKTTSSGSILLLDSFGGDLTIRDIAFDANPNPGTGVACIQFNTTVGDCKNIRVLNCKFKGGGANLVLFDNSGTGAHQFVDVRFENNYFDSTAATGGTGTPIFCSATTGSIRFVFRNNICMGDGTNASAGNHALSMENTLAKQHFQPVVSGNVFDLCTSSGGGIWLGNSTGAKITDNIIHLNTTALDGIELDAGGGGSVQDAIIAGNLVYSDFTTADLGIGVGNDANAASFIKGVLITGNIIKNMGHMGVLVFPGGVNSIQNVTVSNNYVCNCSQSGVFPGMTFDFFGSPGGTLSNCRAVNNIIDTNTTNVNEGIFFSSVTSNNETFGNIINMTGGNPPYLDSGTNNISDYWTAYTPVVTPSGTPGSFAYTATGKYRRAGQGTIAVHIEINVTTLSTAAGVLNVTLPFTAIVTVTMSGQNKTVGFMIGGNGTSTLAVQAYNNTFPVTGNNQFLGLDGICQIGA